MTDAHLLAGWLTGAVSLIATLYATCAGWCVSPGRFSANVASGRTPGVTLLKPLFGDEPELAENLRAYFEQDYDGPVQIVFGTHSATDPALMIARSLQADHPGVEVEFVADPHFVGLNPKAANLANMLPNARYDILITSDSDIRVPANYVRTLVAELSRANVGAVTCLYRGEPRGSIWAVLEAMSIDYAFFPNAVLGTSVGLARPCFGSTIAIRRSVLDEIGGFQAVAAHLADDYEIGRAVRARGYDVKLSSLVVTHLCSERTFADLFRHEFRWSKTVRLLDPAGYAGSVITHPLPLAFVAAAFQSPVPATGMVAAALCVRLWLVWRVRQILGGRAGPLWLLPVRDIISFVVYFASWFGNSIYWRGNRYLTRADGVLAQR